MASQQPAEAEASFRAALAAWDKGAFGVDDQTDARIGLARALLVHDPKSKEAAATLDAAVRDDGGSAEAHYWLAKVSAEAGDHDKARANADKAIELDDAYAEALALDGDLWRASNKDKAKKAYKKYLEVAPNGELAKSVRRDLAKLK
jgi:tetratricopeptide (TPR) repeat protein